MGGWFTLANLASFWASDEVASINAIYIHVFLGVCVRAQQHALGVVSAGGPVPSWACLQGRPPLLKQVLCSTQYTEGKLDHQHPAVSDVTLPGQLANEGR